MVQRLGQEGVSVSQGARATPGPEQVMTDWKVPQMARETFLSVLTAATALAAGVSLLWWLSVV